MSAHPALGTAGLANAERPMTNRGAAGACSAESQLLERCRDGMS